MYTLSDTQIDFILDDIRRNGVELEDLQLNLLDHICCIIEQNLEDNGDFEQFYFSTRKMFYRHHLKEIEEETISLMTYKNYYMMKKIMMISGVVSVALMTMGIVLKFLHWPGAAVGIVLGVGVISLIFLPLLFLLKIKEQNQLKDKALTGLGTLSAICLTLGVLFKVMHWPGANMLSIIALAFLMCLYLPVYFFSGIRNPDTKTNTIVNSVLIITACGLILTLVRSPQGTRILEAQITSDYIMKDDLLKTEIALSRNNSLSDSVAVVAAGKKVFDLCEKMKEEIIQIETGKKTIDPNFNSEEQMIGITDFHQVVTDNPTAKSTYDALMNAVDDYNNKYANAGSSVHRLVLETANDRDFKSYDALTRIVMVQMFLLQNQRR
ncbi:MAG TPA: hypothetical protein PLG57_05340 [Bacteroidia bacterium]|nr:hypothetical protein [Bacteroidia bacterium]HQK96837.1 hypothetical protein [Bacteroidia bacterium]